jgi:hypothetical protein
VAIALALAGPTAAWSDPSGAVANLQSPVTNGELSLIVQATESENIGLRSASAYVDGQLKSTAAFASDACRGATPTCPAFLTLKVNTGKNDMADGQHDLDVVIEDMLGRTFNVPRQTFEVDNTVRVYTPTVTIDVSSGSILPSPPVGGDDAPPPGGGASCAAPRLSMFLAQTPLGFRRGVPLLRAGKRYRYLGQLTCRVNGRRRPARRGTVVQFRIRIGGRTVAQESLKVRKDRRLLLKAAFPAGPRVLVFSARGAGGDTVSVRVPVRVVKAKKRVRR